MATIDKNELEHLAELARLKLEPQEEKKFLHDFEKILKHFEELKELPKRAIAPKAKRVVLREDGEILPDHFTNQKGIKQQFPNSQNDYLKIPPIFE